VAELTRAFLGRHGRAGPKPAPDGEGRP